MRRSTCWGCPTGCDTERATPISVRADDDPSVTEDPTESDEQAESEDPPETDDVPPEWSEGDAEPTVERLHDHLAATRARPVERDASRWIAEAEAVAADVAGDEVSERVLARRLGHVRDLLANVDGTEDPEADAHLRAARRLVDALLDDVQGS